MTHRLPALDWMRGIVMVLMASDHASEAFNATRPVTDSALFPGWQQPLDAGPFLFRWLSHLCAPVFLFLAGTSLALSIERKRQAGASQRGVDRDLLLRGLLILAVDLLFINWLWEPGILLLQVMYAIGLSMICMIGLRRLPDPWLAGFALLALTLGEWARTGSMFVPLEPLPAANAFLVNAGWMQLRVFDMGATVCAYPVLPWCAMMAMGWILGRFLLRQGGEPAGHSRTLRALTAAGAVSLVVFVVLRGLNGFGNLGLVRMDGSLLQWLHVSKYPPSLTFTALELGLMFLLLAALFRVPAARTGRTSPGNPILVFGQTAFFFYVAHILLLEVGARLSGQHQAGDLGDALVALALALLALYPLCLGYRRLKSAHPRSVLRFF